MIMDGVGGAAAVDTSSNDGGVGGQSFPDTSDNATATDASAAKSNAQSGQQSGASTQTVTVKPGDTLSGIAQQHHVSLQALYKANPQFDPSLSGGPVQHSRSPQGGWDPDYIRPGDKVNLPAQTATGSAQTGTKPAGTTPAKTPSGTTNDNHGATPTASTDQQVHTIVAAAQKESDPVKALHTLNDGYTKAPQAVQDALQHDAGAQSVIDKAVNWANAPLHTTGGALLPEARSFQAIQRLDQATQGLDQHLAGIVADRAAPSYQQFAKDNQNALPGGTPFGSQGMTTLVNLSGRITGTPEGNDAVSRFASTGGWNTDSVRNAIADGADPAYAIEFGRQMKAGGNDPSIVTQTITDGIAQRDQQKISNGASLAPTINVAQRTQAAGLDASGVMKVATDGAQQFKDKTAGDVKALADHDAELAFLVKNDGAGMSPDQLNKAVVDYEKKQGPAWQAQDTKLRQQIANDGSKLIQQMTELNQLSPSLSGSRAAADATLKTIANDPSASLAISSAIQTDPSLADPAKVKPIADVFTEAKIGDIGRKYTNELASAYVRQNVLSKMEGVNLQDPASVAAAKKAIGSLDTETFAKLTGVTKSDLDKAVAQVQKSADKIAAAKTPDEVNAAAAELDSKLNNDASLSKAFNKTTLPGQLLRGVGVAFAGAGLINSYEKFNANPSDPQNGIKLLLDSAGFAQKNSELLVGLGVVDKQSAIGQFGGEWKFLGRASAGDLIGGVSAVLDGVSAVRSGFGLGVPQDTGKAIFSATTAVGGGLTVAPAFGAAAWLGPVGLGVTAVGVLGGAIYNAHEDAHKYEAASSSFLQAAGYNANAASALSSRDGLLSGAAGAAQMPFLAKYAEMKHLGTDQLMSWVNSLSPSQLKDLSGCLLQTAGDAHGDTGQFTNGPPQTTYIVDYSSGMATPITLSNTLGVFEQNLNASHVPHP